MKNQTAGWLIPRLIVAFTLLSGIAGGPIVSAQSVPNDAFGRQRTTSVQSDSVEDSSAGHQPSLLTPLKGRPETAPYSRITSRQRLRWFVTTTIGPQHLAGGLFTSAFGTALDRPKEYGPHWGGFADRFGMRMTGIVTGNAMEATIGSLWGEDSRYFRVPEQPFKARAGHVVRLTFMARRPEGNFEPAYARYIAVAGNNFLSNTWRVQSESNTQDVLLRTADGFAGRMAANAFEEFWPDIKTFVFHRGRPQSE
jgi:hypothetical protein